MKPITRFMYRFIGIAMSFLISIYILNAQQKNANIDQIITLSKKELSIKKTLEEIKNTTGIKILFSSKEDYLNNKIVYPIRSLSIEAIFNEIKKQAPVEIIKESEYYIVKERILKKTYKYKGSVKDASTKEILIGAQIYIPGTSVGVVSDKNGNFELNLKPGIYHVKFRYMGYKEKTQTVNLFNDQRIELSLEISEKKIQEVKVTENRREPESFEIGRPIETIEAKTINGLNTNDVNDALHGRVNGVWATKVSGAPGDHNKIRIRGISSIFGSTDPLYVVDGMIIPVVNFNSLGIADLNTHDVESIVILKDASSTALYGYQGGNGVVLIETKKGGGETKFNFNVKQGLQRFSNRYDLLDSKEFYNALEHADKNIRTKFYTISTSPEKYELYPYYTDSLGNEIGSTDFQEELFKIGTISEYQLSSEGDIKGIDYYMSGNYYKHNGVLINSNYTKYGFTGNFSKIINNKASISLQYRGSHQENSNNLDNYLGNDVIFKGINFEPAYHFTPDSFLTKENRLFYNDLESPSIKSLGDTRTMPDSLFHTKQQSKLVNAHSTGLNGIYHISENLSLKAWLALSFRNTQYTSLIPRKLEVNRSKFLQSSDNTIIFTQQYQLAYKKSFNDHSLDAFLQFRNYKDNVYWRIDSTKNVELDGLTPEDNIYLRGSLAIYGEKGSVLRSINSYITNFNYNFSNKYFVSVLFNYDQLVEGYYVSTNDLFPSVAVSWDLSKEITFGLPNWINKFMLYANFGKSGNYPLNGLSNDLYSTSNEYTVNGNPERAVYISNLANHHLKHEKVTETNYGVDISLVKNRVNIRGDYYSKQNSNLLIMRNIPYYYGGGNFYQNIGEMQNTGYELSFEVTPIINKDYHWTSKLGYSANKQYISKLYNGEEINFNKTDVLFPDFYARENETLGDITGYKYLGTWKDFEDKNLESEDPIYVEHNGLAYLKVDSIPSKKIADGDKTIIGNTIPKFNLNWLNVFNYKNFTCEMLWYGSFGFDKYNATKASTYITGVNNNVKTIINDSLKYHTDNFFYESSFFVEDASFIKLKTLSFIYSPNKKIASRIGMQFKLSFENLLTLTKYSGYDPEATVYTNNNFTDNAIDKGSYPNPRSVFFSVNLNF